MDVSAAEHAVTSRHLRRVWALPGTVLGRSRWPAAVDQRLHWHWNYWWQAHLLDTLVDAQLRAPSPARLASIRAFVRSVRLRNFGRWTNDYYDDIAWLGLALQRVSSLGIDVGPALAAIDTQLLSGWTAAAGGGIWWRRGDDFKNAPANGPAAIFHARSGNVARAREMTSWLTSTLVDPSSGLVWDGIRADTGELVKHIYTYCQGVYLGACLELSLMDEAARTIAYSRNQLRPQFDASLALTRRETADSLPSSFGLDNFRFATFFTIAMPVDRTPQIIEYQNALIDRDRRTRDLEMFRKRIAADVKRSMRETARMTERLRVSEESLEISQREVEVAHFRYERGLSNNLDVVAAEGGLMLAENRRLAALAELALSRLSLRATLGILDARQDVADAAPGGVNRVTHD